jgi:hypothetical protein
MGLEVLRFADRDMKRDIANVLRRIEGRIEERRKTYNGSKQGRTQGQPPDPLQKANCSDKPLGNPLPRLEASHFSKGEF